MPSHLYTDLHIEHTHKENNHPFPICTEPLQVEQTPPGQADRHTQASVLQPKLPLRCPATAADRFLFHFSCNFFDLR